MKELLYYSIFAIVLYFVLTHVFENFYLEQENFDPSLVPVSSIVTLAKVAQKLVNGNGTLTNPGSLTVTGLLTANTNLNVSGNTTVNGNSTVNGNITISNSRTDTGIVIDTANPFITFKKSGQPVANLPQIYSAGNDIHVYNASGGFVVDTGGATINGNSVLNGNFNVNGNLSSTKLDVAGGGVSTIGDILAKGGYMGYDGTSVQSAKFPYGLTAGTATSAQTIKSFGPVVSNSLTVGPGSIQFNGPVSVGTNLTVSGTATVTGKLTAGDTTLSSAKVSNLTIKEGAYPNSAVFAYGDGTGYKVSFGDPNNPRVFIRDNGQICIGSTCIDESHLKMLTGSQAMNIDVNTAVSAAATGGRTVLGANGYAAGGVNANWTNYNDSTPVQVFLKKV